MNEDLAMPKDLPGPDVSLPAKRGRGKPRISRRRWIAI